MASSSFHKMHECLVHGYVKEEYITKDDTSYPSDLNKLILEFLGNCLLKFDYFTNAMAKYVHDDGTRLQSVYAQRVTVASSFGINKGVINIDIECIKPGKWDIIAIGSNLEECKRKEWISYMKGYKYWWYQGMGIFGEKDSKDIVDRLSDKEKWNAKDIISMKIDCDEWGITFYKNKKATYTMPMHQDTTYYLIMITLGEYRIL